MGLCTDVKENDIIHTRGTLLRPVLRASIVFDKSL
jgi:hypothetical protein